MHHEQPSRIPTAVGWINERGPGDAPGTVLPDGCMDIMWFGEELLVCGPDTVARTVTPTAGVKVGLRFAPGHLPTILGQPADAVVDERVALADLVRTAGDRRSIGDAEDALSASPTIDHLERLATALGAGCTSTGFEDAVTRLAVAGRPVSTIAAELGMGPRHLHRRCLAAFGYGPKVLGRVLRLQRAVALGREGHPAATVAPLTGYADQSHLARDVRSLADTTWTDLVAPAPPADQPRGAYRSTALPSGSETWA